MENVCVNIQDVNIICGTLCGKLILEVETNMKKIDRVNLFK